MRVTDVVCLTIMMLINDNISNAHGDNMQINYSINNKIFRAL